MSTPTETLNIMGTVERTNETRDNLPVYSVGGQAGKWSGRAMPSQRGARVFVTMNGFGLGTVKGHFITGGFLGLEVAPDVRPAWHVKQAGKDWAGVIHVFGVEVEPVARAYYLRVTENRAKSKGAFLYEIVDTADGRVLDSRNSNRTYGVGVVMIQTKGLNGELPKPYALGYSRDPNTAAALARDHIRRCPSSAPEIAGLALKSCLA